MLVFVVGLQDVIEFRLFVFNHIGPHWDHDPV